MASPYCCSSRYFCPSSSCSAICCSRLFPQPAARKIPVSRKISSKNRGFCFSISCIPFLFHRPLIFFFHPGIDLPLTAPCGKYQDQVQHNSQPQSTGSCQKQYGSRSHTNSPFVYWVSQPPSARSRIIFSSICISVSPSNRLSSYSFRALS